MEKIPQDMLSDGICFANGGKINQVQKCGRIRSSRLVFERLRDSYVPSGTVRRTQWYEVDERAGERGRMARSTTSHQVEDISKVKCIVLPVDSSSLHWRLVIAKIGYGSVIKVYFYDPPGRRDNILEHEWEEGLLSYLTQWHDDYNLQIAS